MRQALDESEAEWDAYAATLRKVDREHFRMLWNYARRHVDAMSSQPEPDLFRTTMMSILVVLERRVKELEARMEALQADHRPPTGDEVAP